MIQLLRMAYLEFTGKGHPEDMDDVNMEIWNSDSTSDKAVRSSLSTALSRPAFFRRKQQIVDQTVSEVLGSVTEHGTSLQKIFAKTHQRSALVLILLRIGLRQNAINLAKDTLSKALKYGLSDIAYSMSSVLLKNYALHTRDTKRYHEMARIADKSLVDLQNETLVERVYHDIMHQGSAGKVLAERLVLMEEALEVTRTPRFAISFYLAKNAVLQLSNDWPGVLDNAKAAIEFHRNLSYRHPIPIGMFMNKLAMAHLHLGSLTIARNVIEEAMSLTEVPSVSQAITKEMLFICLMHDGDYVTAGDVLREMVAFQKKRNVGALMNERHILYRLYLSIAKDDTSGIRLQKELNNLDVYSQDHSSMNLALIIAELIIRTRKSGTLDFVRASHERLQKYMYRHLKGRRSRAKIFVKLLLALPVSLYDTQKFERKESNLLDELSQLPPTKSVDSEEMEIIPYPELWQIIKQTLLSKADV